jgi:hypothetical protein
MLNVGNEITFKQLMAELQKAEPPKIVVEPKPTISPQAYTDMFITRLSVQKGITHA